MTRPKAMICCMLLLATATAAQAQVFYEKRSLSAAAAKRAVAACEAMALKNGWTQTITVVDEAGNLIAFLKMDGAGLNTIDFSLGKAKTALRVQAPSTDLLDRLAKGQTSVLTWGLLPSQGGLPIKVDGKTIGAIGASGAGSAEDERCAAVGVEAALR